MVTNRVQRRKRQRILIVRFNKSKEEEKEDH